ncbi:MAG: hypothetical protein M3Y87_26045 [Myxococcota bacterium]|nr:hypothetical protein [Myxococcota bacterium]
MTLRATCAITALALAVACSGSSDAAPPAPVPPTPVPPDIAAAPVSCTPPGLEAARAVEILTLPPGCTIESAGPPSQPRTITTSEELAAHLRCEGAEAPAIDLAEHDLVAVALDISPASAGHAIFDDGTTVTFVSRQRRPCPGDPQPMPITSTITFLLPSDAARAWRQASCSLPLRCP